MPYKDTISSNPFRQQNPLSNPLGTNMTNPLSKPLYSPVRKPVSTTVGNVTVNTTKPVLLQTQQGDTPVAGDDLQKEGFWASKSKKQKTIIIVGAVAIVSLIAYFAFKKK